MGQTAENEKIPQLVKMLRTSGIEVDGFRLLDMLWLARLLPKVSEVAETGGGGEGSGAGVLAGGQDNKPVETTAQSYLEWSIETIVKRDVYELGDVYVTAQQSTDGQVRVSRHRVAGVPALPQATGLARSLRPFRKVRLRGSGTVDEEATADRIVESRLILPVIRPGKQQRYDAVVVLDDRPSMVVWRETAHELTRLLEYHGAFRDARLVRLVERVKDADLSILTEGGIETSIQSMTDPSGDRIIFLLSDGVAETWQDGRIKKVIEEWGRSMPVVLLQVLGEHQWSRTYHGEPAAMATAVVSGSPNRRLSVGEDAAINEVVLPVIMPYPRSMDRWAQMLMRRKGDISALILRTDGDQQSDESPDAAPPQPPSIEQRFSCLSSRARRLACFLAAVPLQPGVMRLVQRVMMPDSQIEHLAEVMLSGLIHRPERKLDFVDESEDNILFDFVGTETRHWLIEQLRYSELRKVLDSVSNYLSERLNRRYDLAALIRDAEGELKVDEEAVPFARIAQEALALHGIGNRRKSGRFIEERINGRVRLQQFSFKTVTLDEYGRETSRKKNGEAWGYTEPLADGVALEMVRIDGGSFLMGSPESETNRYDDEGPVRRVTVPDFYIGKYAVTQAEWRVVAGWEKVEIDLNPEPSYFPKKSDRRIGDDDRRPVEQVSWFEAREFCARLTRQTGRVYRLPSEAEWEYACRAGSTTPFAFGPTVTPDQVNYNGNYLYGKAMSGLYREETIPVGSLGVANGWGLFDMHGNVLEWCEDHAGSYEGAPTDGRPYVTGDVDGNRRLRGGSWNLNGVNCRSAFRNVGGPGYRGNYVGLRVVVCARTLRPQPSGP